jgi:hypothetical protein
MASDKNMLVKNKILHLAYCVKEVRDLNGKMMQQQNKENYTMIRASLYLWLNIVVVTKSK